MSIVQAVLLGILGGFGIWDSRVFGLWMIERGNWYCKGKGDRT